MGFGDLSRPEGLESLNNFLLTRSYIDGFQPSKADAVVFDAISKDPDSKYINVLRWFNHIKSFGDQRKKFPGQAKNADSYGPPCTSTPASEDDDDDVDLFGSDDDEKAEGRQPADENSAKKGIKVNKPIAKSLIVLDVKPWDDETDMTALEQAVRSIETDGLLWGTSKLVPLFQDLKKLQITCVVEDDKVGTDFLEEEIVKFDQYVQSVDIAAFNKL